MRYLLFIFISLIPLPLASARPIWQWTEIVLIALMAIFVSLKWRVKPGQPDLGWEAIRWPALLFLVLVFWGLAQSSFGHPFGDLIALPDTATQLLETMSTDPAQTQKVALLILSHLVLFVLVIRSIGSRGQVFPWLERLGWVFALYAAYGLMVFFSGKEVILWMEKTAYLGVVTSTFVNANGFAAYMGLGLLIQSAVILRQLMTDTHDRSRAGNLSEILDIFLHRGLLQFAGLLTILTALILTGSRTGIITSITAAMILFLGAGALNTARQRIGSITAGLLVLVGAFILSGSNFLSRMRSPLEGENRLDIYASALKAMLVQPIGGYGLGTFEDVFRIFRQPEVEIYYVRAHSDILELVLTAGFPAALCFLAAFLLIFRRLLKARSLDRANRIIAFLGLAAMTQLFLHSCADFPLQLPAVSYSFTYILALSCMSFVSPSWSRQKASQSRNPFI